MPRAHLLFVPEWVAGRVAVGPVRCANSAIMMRYFVFNKKNVEREVRGLKMGRGGAYREFLRQDEYPQAEAYATSHRF